MSTVIRANMKARDKLKRAPHKARRTSIEIRKMAEAWWYENAKSIDVYIQPIDGGDAVSCRILRKDLAAIRELA